MRKGGEIDPSIEMRLQHGGEITAIARDDAIDLAVIGEGEQRALRHGVDGIGRREARDIERVRRGLVLGAGGGEEQPLRPRAQVFQALPAIALQKVAIGLVGLAADGEAERVLDRGRHLLGHRAIPAADEERGDGAHIGGLAFGDATFQPAQIGFGAGEVLVAGEKERHVHRHAGIDRILDRGQPLGRARDLDEEVRLGGLGVQFLRLLHRRLRVIGEERGDFERDETIHRAAALVDRQEEISGAREILDGEVEEQRLALVAGIELAVDLGIVPAALGDGVVEDRRVGGEAGHRLGLDIALERAAIEQVSGDVVEPQALAEGVEVMRSCRSHESVSFLACRGGASRLVTSRCVACRCGWSACSLHP
ncbi:hypothetical protein AcidC75_12080 [Acidisoma sp. C75]